MAGAGRDRVPTCDHKEDSQAELDSLLGRTPERRHLRGKTKRWVGYEQCSRATVQRRLGWQCTVQTLWQGPVIFLCRLTVWTSFMFTASVSHVAPGSQQGPSQYLSLHSKNMRMNKETNTSLTKAESGSVPLFLKLPFHTYKRTKLSHEPLCH